MTNTANTTTMLEDEERDDVADLDAFHGLVDRLNRQSVTKRFEAYKDVAWDDAEMQIDPGDPRWELASDYPLAKTEWYQNLPQKTRAEIGLYRVASNMKIGLEFE